MNSAPASALLTGQNLSEAMMSFAHTGLDALGMVPGVGELADGANAGLYAYEGDYFNAGLSAAAMIPFFGDEVTGLKWANKGGKAFFDGAEYSQKVLNQMDNANDILHAFPSSVDGFATEFGQWSNKIGSDGKTYSWLEMNGSYGGKSGTFEYIKDENGLINHRFFNTQ